MLDFDLGKVKRIIIEFERGVVKVEEPTTFTFIVKLEPTEDENDPNIQGEFFANKMTIYSADAQSES